MSDTQVPTAPDYSSLIAQYNNTAGTAAQNGQNAMTWAQQQVANNKALTDQVNNGLLNTQSQFDAETGNKLNSSNNLLSTGDQALLNNAAMYNDPTKVASDMGAAGAQAAQADDAARNASQSELESYGVNPGATRFGGLDAATRLQSAGNRVGAENTASRTDQSLAAGADQAIVNQGNAEAGPRD